MIGKDHQAKGYGTLALQMAIDEMTSRAKRIRTMYKSSNNIAGKLYKNEFYRNWGI